MKFISLLIITGSVFANTCFKTCEDIQQYRKETLRKYKRFQTYNYDRRRIFQDLKFKEFQAIFHKKQVKFNKCITNVLDVAFDRRNEDLIYLAKYIQEVDLIKIPKKDQMRLLHEILGPDSFYSYFKSRHYKWETPFSHYSFTGAATEVHSSLKNFAYSRHEGHKVNLPVYKRVGYSILSEQKNPFLYLYKKLFAKEIKLKARYFDENFSPAVSKIILVEVIRQIARENNEIHKFNEFASKFLLGMRLPENEINGENLNPDFEYSIHNGYFLGSKSFNMDINDKTTPMSFDCTSLIQYCAFGLDSFDDAYSASTLDSPEFKFISSDFVNSFNGYEVKAEDSGSYSRKSIAINNIRKKFEVLPLFCESQLMPGDMIVFKGHMLIFQGYKKRDDGSIAFMTIEAEGSATRSIGNLDREIYAEGKNCSVFQWRRSQILGAKVQAYIARIKK